MKSSAHHPVMSTSNLPLTSAHPNTNVPTLRPAILIVSDTASADPSSDRTGPALRDLFSSQRLQGSGDRWARSIVRIVPDDVLSIQRELVEWCDGVTSGTDDQVGGEGGHVNLIVTTGGTGFARRDFTPEVSW